MSVTAAELERLAEELGLDVVGAAPAVPYVETERHIRERRARGLFGEMRFTIAQPELACHPERLLDGARSVVSAALCYWAPAPEPRPGEGRLPRYTWEDGYAELREKLDALGRRLGGAYRVLVDANQHVDREAAARSGVGFYGKNTMLITRRHGSWVVLGTLVTDGRGGADAAARRRLRLVHALHRGVPHRRARRPRRPRRDALPLLDDAVAGPGRGAMPAPRSRTASTAATSARTSVPGTAGSRSAAPASLSAGSPWCRSWTGWSGRTTSCGAPTTASTCPRNEGRYLKRNALVALGNTGRPEHAGAIEPYLEHEDRELRETGSAGPSRASRSARPSS